MARPQQQPAVAAAYGASAAAAHGATATIMSPPSAANLFPYLAGGAQPYYAPQTSSPYIQRSAAASIGGDVEKDFLKIGDLDMSALSLSAGRPAALERRDVISMVPVGSSGPEIKSHHQEPQPHQLQQQQQQHHQQHRVGLPIFESFGARPPTAAAVSYPSRSTMTGRHPYNPPPPTSSHGGGVERGEHEDIKVIHFGVV
jgi:hypothetical protein